MTMEVHPHGTGMRRLTLINEETGEAQSYLVDDAGQLKVAGAPRKARPTRFSSPYATLFAAGMHLMARDRRIRGADHRVLHAILVNAPLAEREFPVRVALLMETSLMSEPAVTRSLARLVEVGLIQRVRQGWIQFNPRYVWRGGAAAREEALAEKIASAQGAEEELVWHMVEDGDLA